MLDISFPRIDLGIRVVDVRSKTVKLVPYSKSIKKFLFQRDVADTVVSASARAEVEAASWLTELDQPFLAS